MTLTITTSTQLSENQTQILNKLCDNVFENIQIRRRKNKLSTAYYNDNKHVLSDKYINSFISKRIIVDNENDTVTFSGMDRYEPVIWQLDTDDKLRRVTSYIVNSCMIL